MYEHMNYKRMNIADICQLSFTTAIKLHHTGQRSKQYQTNKTTANADPTKHSTQLQTSV